MLETSDVTFEEYHPVVSTMCPKSNKNLFQVIATKESAGGGQYYLAITFIKSPLL